MSSRTSAEAIVGSAEIRHGNKAEKVERKVDKQIYKENKEIVKENRQTDRAMGVARTHRSRRIMNRDTRARILCDDGTWSFVSSGCAGHGGIASRQYNRPIPHASEQGILHANANSAVARAYANGIAARAIARCSDGTFWHALTRTNACYRHGGVARWL